MNKKAVAALLLLVIIGVFFVMACSKSPSSDKASEEKAKITGESKVPPPTKTAAEPSRAIVTAESSGL